jgi:hypothetical protein
MADKIYCGSARVITTQYGELTKVSFHKDDINKMVKFMKGDNLDWINLVVKEKREKVEGKPTHYLEVDEWKPDANRQQPPQEFKRDEIPPENDNTDNLPF